MPRPVADVHEAGICVEQPADFIGVLAGDRGMNGMTVGSGQDTAAAIPRLFQEPRDLGMTSIARHGDQAAVMQPVPFGIGARVEQELYRLQVSFADGEMYRRGVPVFRAAEPRVSFEQPPQRVDVAVFGRGEGVPDDAALLRIELGRSDYRAGDRASFA